MNNWNFNRLYAALTLDFPNVLFDLSNGYKVICRNQKEMAGVVKLLKNKGIKAKGKMFLDDMRATDYTYHVEVTL